MRRLVQFLVMVALLTSLGPASAQAGFGFNDIDLTVTDKNGSVSMQAGSHPFEVTTTFDVNTIEEGGGEYVDGALRNLNVSLPAGLTGNPTATPRCTTLEFLSRVRIEGVPFATCPDSSAIGLVTNVLGTHGKRTNLPPIAVYNLAPPPGVPARVGFWVANVPVTVEFGLNPEPPYNLVARLANTGQPVEVFASEFVVWGNPAHSDHDLLRGHCLRGGGPSGESCSAGVPVEPFVTLPRSCTGPLLTTFDATSWWSGSPLSPGPPVSFSGSVLTGDGFGGLLGATGCGKLGFAPRISAQPTTDQAESPTGLDVFVEIDDEGLTSPAGNAHSDIKKAVVTLPEGMTANPSLAEGLATCSKADLQRETVGSAPGEGCPEAAKIGTIEVETPILEGEILKGQLFIATQDDPATPEPGAENPFDTLLALYMVIKDPELGIILKLPGKVEPDPRTGQLISTFDDLPQQPVSDFRLHFREGGRSPLISPNRCGAFTTEAVFTPWAAPGQTLPTSSSFQITRGVSGGPCPPADPPFSPGFSAGTINNNAATYSPFYMRLTRRDGDQDLTRFSAQLPPGLVAKLAGVDRCPDAAIAAARGRRGRAELAAPSCPADSEIGRVIGGAGVGSQLTYASGKLYMAGPVGGAPLSVVGIVPAVAGPFDVGTVVVRQALQINRRTAEVRVDSAASDPIPHILAGIPLRVRDIRVHVDRSKFTLNPTSCNPFEVAAEIWGGGRDAFTSADDAPVSLAERFQAANCSRLGLKPRLSLRVKGGTKRGDHPGLRGVYRPRKGDANLSDFVLRLPRSAFLDQAHIRTICTRVQFAADRCPKGAIYGRATAFTPLLDKPLKGPVYLRSSNHDLPDFVADLHGLVDIEAVARIDSQDGGIRASFTRAPDAPVTKVIVDLPAGKKGLIVNSRNLCARESKADASLTAHNGRRRSMNPVVRPQCGKQRPRKRGR